jgi:hypothetical protein
MHDLMLPLPGLSPVLGKAVVARFDGGQLSSDAGVLMLAKSSNSVLVSPRGWRPISTIRVPRRKSFTVLPE